MSTTTAHPRFARATPQAIDALLTATDPLWSSPSPFEQNGAHSGYKQCLVVSGGVLRIPEAAPLLEPLQPVREAWLSCIEPGGFIVEHIDGGPYYERWQIPLAPDGALIEEGTKVPVEVGVPFRVHQDRWHSVESPGPGARVSLVVDRDVVVSPVRAPFTRR